MGRSPISCIAGEAGFRNVLGAVGREGVDDLDGVPSVPVGGSVGEQDALNFWAGMSAPRVGDRWRSSFFVLEIIFHLYLEVHGRGGCDRERKRRSCF